jgi:hypothetical protein
MFDIKVAGAVVRGVSMIYATTVGREDASASVMIAPEADQVKISIWPGVSRTTYLRKFIEAQEDKTQRTHSTVSALCSTRLKT